MSLLIGVTYGALAGYVGGWVDDIMMRFVDILYSIPFIFVVIFIITILGEEHTKRRLEEWGIDRITIFYFVVGAIYWLTMARVVRGQVISLRTEPFIEAARSLGVPQARIIWRHILPNLLSVVIVYLTLTIPRVMLFEAFLSFLGLGVEPPDVSWGLLANEGIKVITPVKIYWWLIVFPSLALAQRCMRSISWGTVCAMRSIPNWRRDGRSGIGGDGWGRARQSSPKTATPVALCSTLPTRHLIIEPMLAAPRRAAGRAEPRRPTRRRLRDTARISSMPDRALMGRRAERTRCLSNAIDRRESLATARSGFAAALCGVAPST